MSNEQDIIGMTLEQAQEHLKPLRVRVVVQDGQPRMKTADYQPSRVNVSINDGKITNVTGRG